MAAKINFFFWLANAEARIAIAAIFVGGTEQNRETL
jgi:hypothetical protein